MYASENDACAVAERFLRDAPFNYAGRPRVLSSDVLNERELTHLRTAVDLPLVRLYGSGLNAIGQDVWLTTADPSAYLLTRHWATSIRRWAPGAAGFVWMSRFDNSLKAYVLFEDDVPPGSVTLASPSIPLWFGAGRALVESILLNYLTAIQ